MSRIMEENTNEKVDDGMIAQIIKSKYVLEYIEKMRFGFDDRTLATLIFQLVRGQDNVHSALLKLAEQTRDSKLRKEIHERISRDKELFRVFEENKSNCFYELLADEETDEFSEGQLLGHFFTLDNAVSHGKQYGINFCVNKYEFSDLTDDSGRRGSYNNGPVAGVKYDMLGQIVSFWSEEINDEERYAVAGWEHYGFEDSFVVLPNPFERGDIVCMANNRNNIGVVETSQVQWKGFLKRVKENNIPVDVYDASITVEFLGLDGSFSHEHIAPVLLEKLELDDGDKRLNLLEAASRLIRGEGALDTFLLFYEEHCANLVAKR